MNKFVTFLKTYNLLQVVGQTVTNHITEVIRRMASIFTNKLLAHC